MAVTLMRSLQFPSAAYTAALPDPPEDVLLLGPKAVSSRSTRWLSQRTVTTDAFYGSEKGWFDNVLVLADDEGEDDLGVWSGHALCLVRVCKEGDWQPHHQHLRWYCPHSSFNAPSELCSLQSFDLLEESKVALDKIDKIMKCLLFRWQWNEGKIENISAEKLFWLELAESIRDVIHIHRRDTAVSEFCSNHRSRVESENLKNGRNGWEAYQFHVYPFFRI